MFDVLGQLVFCEVQYISFLLKRVGPMNNFNFKQIQLMYLKYSVVWSLITNQFLGKE